MSELIITEKSNITAIADAVRNKTGSSSGLTLNGIIEGINSISGDGNGSITRIINIDSSEDAERNGSIVYISNDKTITAYCYEVNTIEADYGIVILSGVNDSMWDNVFLNLGRHESGGHILVATQDNGTIYVISGDQQ